MDPSAYLERIGYRGNLDPKLEVLKALHRAHLFSVPFENLDIHLKRPIILSLPALYDKVVRRRRGGFCYELNALFWWLLEESGFESQMLSGRVFGGADFGAEFDHMLLKVRLDNVLIADVGFGDSFIDPISLAERAQVQNGNSFRLVKQENDWILSRKAFDADWQSQYLFTFQPRALEDFEAMCHFHQTSPESSFTRKSVCSLATRSGRVTLAEDRLITTCNGQREERRIRSTAEYRSLLEERFGVDLENDANIDVLLHPNRPSAKEYPNAL